MEQHTPEEKPEYFLDLNTQESFVELTDPQGCRQLIAKGADGRKKVEITYDPDGTPIKMTQFSDADQPRVLTDPALLAEVDEQIKGLLGVKVEENTNDEDGLMTSAVQDGEQTSMYKLKTQLLDESLQMGIGVEQLKNPTQNPKGH